MSYIKMESKEIVSKCDEVSSAIERLKESYRKRYLEEYVKEKNSGLGGWLRKIFKKKCTIENTKEKLEKEYSFKNEYFRINYFFRTEERIIRLLCSAAENFSEVLVSCEDLDKLNHIITHDSWNARQQTNTP